MSGEKETVVERGARRRVRRWKRRLRSVAPLLVLPGVFALLASSVNLIEYRRSPKEREPVEAVAPRADDAAAPAKAIEPSGAVPVDSFGLDMTNEALVPSALAQSVVEAGLPLQGSRESTPR